MGRSIHLRLLILATCCGCAVHTLPPAPQPAAKPVAKSPPPDPTNGPPGRGTIVAVFDIEDAAKEFDQKTTDQLTEYLASRVNEVAGYRIIPREQMRERLQQEKADTYRACFEQACQIELGKALAAQKTLATKVLHVGSGCLMTATLFDLKTETTERSVTAKTECNASALVIGADHLAQELRSEAY